MCTITFPPFRRSAVKSMVVEWAPSAPRRLSVRQMREYHAGRDRAIAEFAGMAGVKALVID
jgi:hypothetical protein